MKELTLTQKMTLDGQKLALENIKRIEKELQKETDPFAIEYLINSHLEWIRGFNNYIELFDSFTKKLEGECGKMTGNEFLEKYKCNPDNIEFEGLIYTELDLVSMDSCDYEEVMEYGIVVYL